MHSQMLTLFRLQSPVQPNDCQGLLEHRLHSSAIQVHPGRARVCLRPRPENWSSQAESPKHARDRSAQLGAGTFRDIGQGIQHT